MKTPLRILHLEDDPADAELIRETLEAEGVAPEITVVQTEADYVAQLDQNWEIILVDYNLPQFDGMKAIRLVKERGLDLSIILISGTIGEDVAVTAMRAGASDYVMKDHLARLGPAVKRGLKETVERRERKQAATEEEKLKEQLIQAQKIESIGQLAGGVAHDFNNKLQIILGHTEIALGGTDVSDRVHENLIEIQKASLHSADLTRQLLAFARKQTISPKVLDLNATVEEMLKMLRRLIGEDIDLHWEPSAKLWPVRMDPSQIDQILANLCVNARDAIAGTGKVTIATRNITLDQASCAIHPDSIPGDYVQLSFSDDGCGIEQQVLDHIFEPFFTTKKLGEGTGLGLATLYGIVKQNMGLTMVYSTPEHGTTFKIYLPRCADEEVAAEEAAEKKPSERGYETILLVEDEAMLLDLGQQMLEALGYTVLAAQWPEEALRLAKEDNGEIDLLLTDVIMPRMNGQDLAAQLKKTHPKLKCIFMSGYTADVIARNNVLAEGVQFIQKPFSTHELAAKLRRVLEC